MRCLLVCTLLLVSTALSAAEVRVAVAANFLPTLRQLAPLFEEHSGHRLVISAGSTGKLYAQIIHGAPFDLLLAADALYTRRLEGEKRLVSGSRFVYARGQLVLWSRDPQPFGAEQLVELLSRSSIRHLAIANPQTAPYGAAAAQYLKAVELWSTLEPKLVRGESVAQTFQFVASGAAELGFVALSQALEWQRAAKGGVMWRVPPALYTPLAQEAGLLRRAENSEAARAFLQFLQSDAARRIINSSGYEVE